MIRQGKSEIQDGANIGAGVVHTSMALAGLEVYNAGALPFVGGAGENKMTNKTKSQAHTPGPWEQSGEYIHARGPELGHYPYQRKIMTVATVHPLADGKNNAALEGQDMANARLIAAAPELLEAAKALIKRLEDMTTEEYARSGEKVERDRLCATIAKAEGQEVR